MPRRGTNVPCLRRHFIFILFHQEKHLCLGAFFAELNYFSCGAEQVQKGEGEWQGQGQRQGNATQRSVLLIIWQTFCDTQHYRVNYILCMPKTTQHMLSHAHIQHTHITHTMHTHTHTHAYCFRLPFSF